MFKVFGFYKFIKIKSLKKKKFLLEDFLIKKNIRGTIIIATEGINATISGKTTDLKSTITNIKIAIRFIMKISLLTTAPLKVSLGYISLVGQGQYKS